MEEMTDLKRQIISNTMRVKNLSNDVKELENKGHNKKMFFSSDKRHYNDQLNKLRAATYVVDKEYRMYKIQTGLNEEMVCHYYLGLILGIIYTLISLAWFIHM